LNNLKKSLRVREEPRRRRSSGRAGLDPGPRVILLKIVPGSRVADEYILARDDEEKKKERKKNFSLFCHPDVHRDPGLSLLIEKEFLCYDEFVMEKDLEKIRRDIVFSTDLQGENIIFHSTWGLFSPTEIDEGSRLLLDIGCGYGAIGIPLAKRSPTGTMHMIDKDFVAVEYAKKNAAMNHASNCETYLSNGFSNVPDIKFDAIVSNLPAKVGREFFWLLLHDAKQHLKPGGEIYVVTISGLREFIKRNFNEVFGNYEKVKQGKNYTIGKAINSPLGPSD
jgi:precorrin-6B methylase 2